MNKKINIQKERWEKIAGIMREKKLEVVLVCSSLQDFGLGFSLTGLKPIFYHYLFLDKAGGKLRKGYFVPYFLVDRLGLENKPHVETFDDKKIPEDFARFLKKFRKVGILGPAPAIHFSLTGAELVFLDEEMWPILNRKSGAEIKAVAKVAGLLDKVLNRAGKLLKPGVRLDAVSEQLDREILKTADSLAFPTLAESRHGNKNLLYLLGVKAKIHSRDLIYINAGAEMNGVFADAGRSYFLNNEALKRDYARFEQAFDSFVAAIKPGMKLCELPLLLKKQLKEQGLAGLTFDEKYIGHSVGFNIINMPYIGREIFTSETVQADTTLSLVIQAKWKGQQFQLQDTVWIGEENNKILTRL
jgi:Xaa-Pro aminopeptidase